MHLTGISTLAACSLTTLAAQVNRTATNGWGSTPSQRHYINQTQALAVINAAIEFSTSIEYAPHWSTKTRAKQAANVSKANPTTSPSSTPLANSSPSSAWITPT